MGLIVGAEGLAGVISPLWSEFALSNNIFMLSYCHIHLTFLFSQLMHYMKQLESGHILR